MLFGTVMRLVAIAIPIAIAVTIIRRAQQVAQRLRDPNRLQQGIAESAAAALGRAGADPRAATKVQVLGMGAPGERTAIDLLDALQEARAALQTSSAGRQPRIAASPPPRPSLPRRPEPSPRPQRAPRPRPSAPVAPLGGLDTGDRFRLSEPPDTGESQGPLPFSASWLALAAVIGAAAWYWMN